MFGCFFNLVEVAQEINLYAYLNANKPLNLDDLLQFFSNFRIYQHVSIFKKIGVNPKNSTSNNTNNTNKSRVFNPSDQIPPPLFQIKGFSSSFLSNASSVLLIVILMPFGIFLLLKLTDKIIARRNKRISLINLNKKPKGRIHKLFEDLWSRKEALLLDTLFSLLLASIQEIQFFFALQISNISFADSSNILSFLGSIFWVIPFFG